MTKHLKQMDMLRGIGIVLVVLGHSFPDSNTGTFNNNEIYKFIYKFIYSFHMPLFFFISGFFALKIYKIYSSNDYKNFIVTKAKRLIVPYFMVTFIAIPVKLILNKFAIRPINLDTLLKNTFLYPWDNPIIFFWFIYTLFIIFLLAPLLIKIPQKYLFMILIILNIIPLNYGEIFNINGVVHYFIYFYLGLIFRNYYNRYLMLNKKYLYTAIGLIFLFLLNTIDTKNIVTIQLLGFLEAVLGIIVCLNLSHTIPLILEKTFEIIGEYSYDIFLFSWFFQTGSRVVFLQKLQFNYDIVVLLMFILGFTPILLSKLFLRKNNFTSIIFLGNKAETQITICK